MPPTTQRPTITPEGKAAAERIAAARAERNANPTSVTADQLSQPVSQVTVPQPQVAETTPVNQNMVKGVGTNTQNIIAAQTEEAANLRGLREQQAQIAGEGTLSDLFKTQQEQFGIPENLKTLQDLQLQMADMNTESNVTQTRIGQGNSIAQGNREITQEQRENAVRQAGTAARAAIIQGNIETASALVSQAVQTAYQDRTLRNSNLINQINSLQGVVDNQTSQLLEADKRQYEEDQAVIQRVQDAVDDAMNSGAATQEDIRTLTDPKLSDEDRLAAAQGIVSRGQTELRDLDVLQSEASIRSSNASAARSETGRLLDLAEAGDQAAIARLGLTMPDNSQPTKDDIAYARQYAATGKVPSGLSSAGVSFGDIAELASDLPKQDGALVDINTNVASANLSSADSASFDALYNAINTDLPLMMGAWEEMNSFGNFGGTGVVGGIASTVKPSAANTRFDTIKADFTAKLVLARSGAAATEDEVNRYLALTPDIFNTPFGLGKDGSDKLDALNNQMRSAFDDKLTSRGLSVYGYSTVNAGGETYTVGEIITSEYGQQGRVNPDGSITLINN